MPRLIMHDPHASRPSLVQRLFQPIDIASLVVFRITFGAIMTWEAFRYLVPREPDGVSWARQFYIDPQVLFKYYGFAWVHPWPGEGMIYHLWAWALAAICVAIGLGYRISAAVLWLLITHMFLLDQTRYLNHMYLICLLSFLLIFLPLNRSASIDAMLRPAIRSHVAPAWTLYLLRFQLAAVYIFSGIARTNGDWMRGEPMRMWLRSRAEDSLFAPLLMSDWAPYLFSFGGMLFDLLIVPLLLWRRTRAIAFCTAVFFHLANAYIFHIGVFPWLGIAATTLFLDPDWPRRLLRRSGATAHAPAVFPLRRGIVVALALYVIVQLFLPLRHLLYRGRVNWTHEGHNFAWRMKLDDRRTRVRFYIVHPSTGHRTGVDLNQFLTPRQQHVMSTRPDMLLQFAHHLARHHQREFGSARPQVYADVAVSLNGRPMKPLVHPHIDLTTRQASLGPADWIVHQELEPIQRSHRADASRLGQ
ncbi:MAG TPA: HTTM domain-containing protein [Tepidisphaeraceae bacterium]|nr:HTTM domain-containing protein [Tepidisphaeraceae bacterium]